MAFFGKSKDNTPNNNVSDGGDYQCDCDADNCFCGGRWFTIPAGRPIPNVFRCDDCRRGNHPK